MKGSKYRTSHTADFLFVLTLFAVFAVSAVLVLMLGVKVYKSTVADMNTNYTTRTVLTYAAQKIRQNDSGGGIRVSEENGMDTLELHARYGDTGYVTYIYDYGGSLRELFIREDAPFDPGAGSALTDADNFTVRSISDTLLYLSVTGPDGVTADTYLTYRSRAAE